MSSVQAFDFRLSEVHVKAEAERIRDEFGNISGRSSNPSGLQLAGALDFLRPREAKSGRFRGHFGMKL